MGASLDDDFPQLLEQGQKEMNAFNELSVVDCSSHVEKKGKFTYLSWPFAFAELFKRYPKAQIDIREWDGFPAVKGPKGWMVCVSVTIDGVTRTQWHPVLDNNNRPIAEPDVFQLNTSIQRGTVKAIALHGLGLYIYAGEDLPEGAAEDAETAKFAESKAMEVRALMGKKDIAGAAKTLNTLGTNGEYDPEAKELVYGRLDSAIRSGIKAYDAITQAKTVEGLTLAWKAAPKHSHDMLLPFATQRKAALTAAAELPEEYMNNVRTEQAAA